MKRRKKQPKRTGIPVRITQGMAEGLDRVADVIGSTRAGVARMAIRQFLADNGKKEFKEFLPMIR